MGTATVNVNASSAGQVSGTVDATLALQLSSFNDPKPATVHLTGDYIVDA